MKLTHDNCRAKLHDVYEPYTASLEAETWNGDWSKVKVVEVPKVWRSNGKQYKVTFVTITLYGHPYSVKAPRGCDVNCYGNGCTSIEYYD